MKTCFKCLRSLNEAEFYRHRSMADGLLGKCKDCAKADVRSNRAGKREQYSAYEQKRTQRPERKQQAAGYLKLMRRKNPEKSAARRAVTKALVSGRLDRKPCAKCGAAKVEAHHVDYRKPLDVQWLCFRCHRAEHGQVVVAQQFSP